MDTHDRQPRAGHTVAQAALVALRAPRDDDRDALLSILTEPAVAEWWVDYTAERVSP